VKTRLARRLGAEAACSLYAAMAGDALRQAGEAAPVALFHDGAPGDEGQLPGAWLRASAFVLPQEGQGLGERMASAFGRLFDGGAERAALAGSDAPGVDGALLRLALDALDDFDGALSPAFDGGYCLVAFRRRGFHRSLFEGIPWSTGEVLARTLAAFAAGGRTAALLPPRRDVDTEGDLREYCLAPAEGAEATNRWLREAGYLPAEGGTEGGGRWRR
jgi:rSAM/selenodomain-associated transferase 1